MSKVRRYSTEVRERAIRMVFEHKKNQGSRWATMVSITSKIGSTPETLRSWVQRIEIDQSQRPGTTTEEGD